MSKFIVESCEIPEVKLLKPQVFEDARGYFCETYSERELCEAGIDLTFVQENQSYSKLVNTVRGLHYQVPPFAQAKLVRVARGAILDVAVDIRKGSPTLGKSVRRLLSEKNMEQLLVPEGFAHGFSVLEENTIVIYKVTNYYSPQHERGICWNDSELNIDWRLTTDEAILSKRDENHAVFEDAIDEEAFKLIA
jgi:dTDP-4-dehydrorhamnose 3,5-epimerase